MIVEWSFNETNFQSLSPREKLLQLTAANEEQRDNGLLAIVTPMDSKSSYLRVSLSVGHGLRFSKASLDILNGLRMTFEDGFESFELQEIQRESGNRQDVSEVTVDYFMIIVPKRMVGRVCDILQSNLAGQDLISSNK